LPWGYLRSTHISSTITRAAFAGVLVVLLGACSAGPSQALGRIDAAEITTHGTATYLADKAKVFEACLGALKVLGYEVAVAQPEKRLIVTSRKETGSFARFNGSGSAAVRSSVAQQYALHVDALGPAETRVVAVPAFFLNEAEMSGERLVLDGPGGIRTSWGSLFNQVRMLL
jgi:hypothetical protein